MWSPSFNSASQLQILSQVSSKQNSHDHDYGLLFEMGDQVLGGGGGAGFEYLKAWK